MKRQLRKELQVLCLILCVIGSLMGISDGDALWVNVVGLVLFCATSLTMATGHTQWLKKVMINE